MITKELTNFLNDKAATPIKELPKGALKEVQELLIACGYPAGEVDGIYGPKTSEAFDAFKVSANMDQPGVIGFGSYSVLKEQAEDRKARKAPTEASPNAVEVAADDDAKEEQAEDKKPTRWTRMLYDGPVYVDSPVLEGGHFTWAEFTKGGTRWPRTQYHTDKIRAIAGVMEEVRALLGGKRIIITSGFRPDDDPILGDVNRQVGGVRNSRHTLGDAVDFWAEGMSVAEAYAIIDPWFGTRGGLAVSYRHHFIHIDLRGLDAPTTKPIRWDY